MRLLADRLRGHVRCSRAAPGGSSDARARAWAPAGASCRSRVRDLPRALRSRAAGARAGRGSPRRRRGRGSTRPSARDSIRLTRCCSADRRSPLRPISAPRASFSCSWPRTSSLDVSPVRSSPRPRGPCARAAPGGSRDPRRAPLGWPRPPGSPRARPTAGRGWRAPLPARRRSVAPRERSRLKSASRRHGRPRSPRPPRSRSPRPAVAIAARLASHVSAGGLMTASLGGRDSRPPRAAVAAVTVSAAVAIAADNRLSSRPRSRPKPSISVRRARRSSRAAEVAAAASRRRPRGVARHRPAPSAAQR